MSEIKYNNITTREIGHENVNVDYKYVRSLLERLIQEKIDSFRLSRNLTSFKRDAVLDLAAADYVELYFQGTKSSSTGTNFTITANATYYQSFWGCYKMIGI